MCELKERDRKPIGHPRVSATNSTTINAGDHHSSNSSVESSSTSAAGTTICSGAGANSWWLIHGAKYDLSEYVGHHPGGAEAILLGRGRDCTALFESYHPFSHRHRAVLKQYKILEETSPTTPTDPFYDVLCSRVSKALLENGIDPRQGRYASSSRIAYYVVISTCLVVSMLAHVKGSTLGSCLFAVFGWLFGALGHDAGHFAVSRIPAVNDVCVWAMSFLCNPVLWQHQHTYGHHSHTNEFDRDPDLHHFHFFLRVHRKIQAQDRYKYQSNLLYVMFSYAFVVFGTCFWIPCGTILDGSLYGIVEWTDRHRPLRAVGMGVHLALYVWIVAILPIYSHYSWVYAAISSVLHVSISGLIFASFSQINHLNEPSLTCIEERDSQMKSSASVHPLVRNSWAAAQIESSNNFAPDSYLWYVLSNGLNLQIEHHLFPGINHCHLHYVTNAVRETCDEYGVKYKCYKTWEDLMAATLAWLDTLSVEVTLGGQNGAGTVGTGEKKVQ